MNTKLPQFSEETNLVEFEDSGRVFYLHPAVLDAWRRMKAAATQDGIDIFIISAFRSVARQTEIIDAKRKKGISDQEIFKVNAPPGRSEHHTGKAIDVGTPGSPPLEEAFENTKAFQWLSSHANGFGFRLSYPRNNGYGIAYEPWHWFYSPSS